MSSSWQPIHTAPLDTPLILTDGKQTVCGYGDEDENRGLRWLYHDYPDDYNLYEFKPTCWMYLPDPIGKEKQEPVEKIEIDDKITLTLF